MMITMIVLPKMMMMIKFKNAPGTQQALSQPLAQHQPAAWPRAVKKIEKSLQSNCREEKLTQSKKEKGIRLLRRE